MPVYKDENKTSDGRQYYFAVSYTTLNGQHKKYKSKKYLTKKEAERCEAEYLLSVGKHKTKTMSFDDIALEYLESRKKEVKIQTYPKIEKLVSHIIEQVGTIKIDKMTKQQYELFRKWINDTGYSIAYKNKINTYFKALITYASKEYGIYNPIPFQYKPFNDPNAIKTKINYLTLDEYKTFISYCKDKNMKALFDTLFFMGLRLGEALALKFDDINFDTNTLSISKTLTTKVQINGDYLVSSPKTSESNRILPMPQIVSNELFDLYIQSNKDGGKYVYGGLKTIPESNVRHMKDNLVKLSKIKHFRIHDLRHSFVSYVINVLPNVSIDLLASYLGHRDKSQIWETYGHLYANKLVDVSTALDNSLK